MDAQKIAGWFASKLTILRWIPEYESEDLKGDLTAGITVGVMLIPQAMAYAVLAGIPPIYGLYASVVPLLIYPLFGTSKHLAVGIVAIDMLVVAAGVSLIAEGGTEKYLHLVLLLGLMAGLIQIAMSVARLGFIVNILSKPVILGFTAAAPIIISFTQLNNLLGINLAQSQQIYVLIGDLWNMATKVDPVTTVIGIGSIVLLLLTRNFFPNAPEALIVVVCGSLVVWGLDFAEEEVRVVGSIPYGLPYPEIPSVEFDELRRLLPTAITLALVQFMNVMSLGRTFASKHKYTIGPNRELFALGSANICGSVFKSVPVSGSFSRSAVSEQAGGRTSLSNVFTAVLIVIALLFLTPVLYYIPMPALAAIIIVASLGLIDVTELRQTFRTKEGDGYIALFTFVTTLGIGIQEGILLGIAASLIAVLVRTSVPHMVELGHIEGSHFFRDVERFPEAQTIRGLLILRVDASFSFNNAEYFKEFILEKSEQEGREIKTVVIEGRSINDLDTTAIEALQAVTESFKKQRIELHFAGLIGPVRDIILRSGLARKLGGTHFHMTTHDAVSYILQKWSKSDTEDPRYQEYRQTID